MGTSAPAKVSGLVRLETSPLPPSHRRSAWCRGVSRRMSRRGGYIYVGLAGDRRLPTWLFMMLHLTAVRTSGGSVSVT